MRPVPQVGAAFLARLKPAPRPWSVAPLLQPTADAVLYDEVGRVHALNGRPVLSVTQILQKAGKSIDLEQLPERVRTIVRAKGELGTRVHIAAHYDDEGDLLPQSVWSEAAPYLEAWQTFRDERRFESELLETVVASTRHHYTGRFDRLGRVRGNPRLILADIKTGDPDNAAADLQLAGYVWALLESHPRLAHAIVAEAFNCTVDPEEPLLAEVAFSLIERWSVRLKNDGTYKVHVYPKPGRTHETDRLEFLDCAREVNVRESLVEVW
jgi:hypothetical protein